MKEFCKFNQIIDLTHSLTSKAPGWDESCKFEQIFTADYSDFSGKDKFRVGRYAFPAGMGTHIDAPSHCYEGGMTVEQLPLEKLIAPCVCIDVSNEADQDFVVTKKHILQFEANNRVIESGDLVVIYTGWSKYWHKAAQYRNNYQFPSVAAEVAEYLVSKDIAGLAIDTLAPDCPKNGFPVHQKILSGGKYIIENIANGDQLPAIGALVFALPLKVAGGTEAPLRMIALVDK